MAAFTPSAVTPSSASHDAFIALQAKTHIKSNDGQAVNFNCYPEVKIQNSRRRKRLGFSVYPPSNSSPRFVQPSKVYPGAKNPGTPPCLAHGAELTRRKQLQPQPSKSDFSKPNQRRDNRPKPYLLEPPPPAQVYPDSKTSDFYPWKGNHPEDHVTDAQARNGQYDKLFVGKGNNEQASAKTLLAPHFKQKNGLSTLSTLFLTIMDKRQENNRVTTPSTFKPPPRVTLPDQRKEAWLRDLANPLVPLRRLSRTIPHGLKGPVLLDHCCAKNIPSARAVWFVRCVGANELRGLKRKGVGSLAVGGEAKWIKEWTGQVIQFLEKAMTLTGANPDSVWKDRVMYSIRLSAHLYAENLVDRNLFLEWCLSYIETSSLDLLPLRFLLASTYYEDFLRTRRFGRRFAETLLKKVETITLAEYGQIALPLARRLSQFLMTIIPNHAESLTLPDNWSRVKITLSLHLINQDPRSRLLMQRVESRNLGLRIFTDTDRSATVDSDRKMVIKCLDSSTVPFDLEKILDQCKNKLHPAELIDCFCEWAVTSLRAGIHRVYLTLALLRWAYEEGLNIQEPVMSFLARFDASVRGSKHDLYLLISELVRMRLFSIPAYMTWLIARGALSKINAIEQPVYVRLLGELPMHHIVPRTRNLRNILLAQCGRDAESDEISLTNQREFLISRGIFNTGHFHSDRHSLLDATERQQIQKLSRTVKNELGLWIRDTLHALAIKGQQVGRDNWRDLTADAGLSNMKARHFMFVRQILEELSDFTVLADVVKSCINCENCETLAAIADTITYHFKVFAVIGSDNESLQLLFDRYRKIHSRRSLEKPLLRALLQLVSLAPGHLRMKQELEVDLDLYDQRYPRLAIAHSPVSDTMGSEYHDNIFESSEEIDRLWNTGAFIDKQTLSRLFETTVSRMETLFDDGENQTQLLLSSQPLVKLKQFGHESFGELIEDWVTRMLHSSNSTTLYRTMSYLVAGDCIQIGTIVDIAMKIGRPVTENGAWLIARTLDLIVSDDAFDSKIPPQGFYTIRLRIQSFLAAHHSEFFGLLRRAIEYCGTTQDVDLKDHILNLLVSVRALDFLRNLATSNINLLMHDLVEPLSAPSHNGIHIPRLQLLIDSLLDDRDTNDNTEVDAHIQVARLLHLANDFSIGLCRLKMRIIFNPGASSIASPDSSATAGNTSIARSFIRGIASTFSDKPRIWSELVSVLNKDCAAQVRSDVEELFLDSATFLRTQALMERLDLPVIDDSEAGESLAHALLSVMEATAFSISNVSPTLSSTLVDRLSRLLQTISIQEESARADANSAELWRHTPDNTLQIQCWILLFLRIAILHRTTFSSSRTSISDQGRMLVGFCALLQTSHVQSDEALHRFVFDIASTYADEMAEDTRNQVRRFVKGKGLSDLLGYLVGGADGVNGGEALKAVQKGRFVEFPVKQWERIAEPTTQSGDNDTSLNMVLFGTTKVRCGSAGAS